jgi:hypothetical protein
MEHGGFFRAMETIAALIVTVAIVALVLSRNATTTSVIQAGASGLGNLIGVSGAPITGSSVSVDLSYPSAATAGAG